MLALRRAGRLPRTNLLRRSFASPAKAGAAPKAAGPAQSSSSAPSLAVGGLGVAAICAGGYQAYSNRDAVAGWAGLGSGQVEPTPPPSPQPAAQPAAAAATFANGGGDPR
eukprot:SAG22_NODE_10564_length_527_cov_1.455607_1_plen_109_part_01